MDKNTFKFCISVLIAILVIPTVIYAASFDCSKANTKTEKAICGDPMLSKLDNDLAIAYSRALKASDRDRTKKSQRKWLKETLAPCSDDKACIKKAYENRLHQLGKGSVTTRPLAADPGKIVSTTKPLKCAQCGIWQDADIGVFVIDDKRIIIPGCGVFDYKIEKYVSTPEPQRADRNTYKVSMLLKQQRTSFLCNNGDEKNWYLEANVSGHFQEGGTADFILRKTKSAEPSLELSGWSMDREDPCDAGSGGGTAACLAIEKSLIYNTLSKYVENAYGILSDIQEQKLPNFNVARFSSTVYQFCEKREEESGGGSWPHAWAIGCQLGILGKKFEEFVSWRTCMQKTENKLASCKFPDESFDRAPKQEEEE